MVCIKFFDLLEIMRSLKSLRPLERLSKMVIDFWRVVLGRQLILYHIVWFFADIKKYWYIFQNLIFQYDTSSDLNLKCVF